jgi:hypothetical protein
MLYPFLDPPYRMRMGLRPLDPAEWIMIDACFEDDLAEKQRLLESRHDEVFAALPAADRGAREVLDRLLAHLPRHFPERYRREGGELLRLADRQRLAVDPPGVHPLDLAGRLVQEDLCLMQGQAEGYVLVAASLCFPSRWRLAEKLGRPLGLIHAPVPGFAATLGQPVERFFDRLAADQGVWRANWSIIDDPALFQPSGHFREGRDAAVTAGNAGAMLWLRVELQTLTRLPQSGDVLFTIRTLREPLARTAAEPARAMRLAALVRSMPAELKRYKSIAPFEPALLGFLDAAGQGKMPGHESGQ